MNHFLHLLADHIFITRQVVPGAEHADGSGEAGAMFHMRKQERIGRTRMVSVMNHKIGFGDAVAKRDYNRFLGEFSAFVLGQEAPAPPPPRRQVTD